jgi:hypothetical protein
MNVDYFSYYFNIIGQEQNNHLFIKFKINKYHLLFID